MERKSRWRGLAAWFALVGLLALTWTTLGRAYPVPPPEPIGRRAGLGGALTERPTQLGDGMHHTTGLGDAGKTGEGIVGVIAEQRLCIVFGRAVRRRSRAKRSPFPKR